MCLFPQSSLKQFAATTMPILYGQHQRLVLWSKHPLYNGLQMPLMGPSITQQQTLWTRQRKTCIRWGWTTCPQTAGTCSEWCLWTGTDPSAPRLSRVKSKREVGCQSEKAVPSVVLLIKWQFQGNVISWPTILSVLITLKITKNWYSTNINETTRVYDYTGFNHEWTLFFLGSSGLAVALGVTFGVLLFLSVAANIYLIYRQSQTKGEQSFYLNHF